MKVRGMCRVEKCKFYNVSLLDLGKHVREAHKMTLAQHKLLPLSSHHRVIENSQGKKHMKHRKVKICLYPNCTSRQAHQQDLTKHLRRQHGISRREYTALR